jgi:small-conductance mechanosensitive channel
MTRVDTGLQRAQAWRVGWIVLLMLCMSSAMAEEPAPAAPEPPKAISLGEVASASDADLARLAGIEAVLAEDRGIERIASDLRSFKDEVSARLQETQRLLAAHPSVDSLLRHESRWSPLRASLLNWERRLERIAAEVQEDAMTLDAIQAVWNETQVTARSDRNVPSATLGRIAEVLRRVRATGVALDKTRASVLTLQDGVSRQTARVVNAIDSLRSARTEAMNNLFRPDDVPLWADDRSGVMQQGQASLNSQFEALRAYLARQGERCLLQFGIFLLSFFLLRHAQRRARGWVEAQPALATPTRMFAVPVANALLIAVVFAPWIYPQAPSVWFVILAIVGVLPASLILRSVLPERLLLLLNGMVLFFFMDQLRSLSASFGFAARALLLLETTLAVVLSVVLLLSGRTSLKDRDLPTRFWQVVKVANLVAVVGFGITCLANIFGYVQLAGVIADLILVSAYWGLFCYALIRLADGWLTTALRLYPLSNLAIVKRHGGLLHDRILLLFELTAWLFWASGMLERLSLRTPLLDTITAILSARSSIGSLRISLGDVLACLITIAAASTVSRLVRFTLDEEVYPRVELPRGIPYALSRLLHYAILVVGFVMAVAAAGVDLTSFTILASAFGVGVGFGLQNIINNFVSGLILLFERPVQVGDTVQIADVNGVVYRIGIRASHIRLGNGAEVIVPNSNFITERVTNRTQINPERSIILRVGVAYGTDSSLVIRLLLGIAAKSSRLAQNPPAQAVFADFGQDAVYYELRCAPAAGQDGAQVRSELGVEIDQLFTAGTLRPPPRHERIALT